MKADAFCRDENMRLLTVETYEEDQIVFSQVKSMSSNVLLYLLIAASCLNWISNDRRWLLLDFGKIFKQSMGMGVYWTFSTDGLHDWYTGEPSNSQIGSFAYINFNFDDTGYWFDEIGSSTYILFICESIDGGTAETTTDATTTLLSSTTNGNLPTTVQSSTTPTTAETE